MNAQLLLIEQQWDSNVVRLRPIRMHDILQRQDTLGKGKLRSPVGGTIYANVIWPGMKWKYAARLRVQINITVTYYYNNYYTTSLRLPVPLISALKLYTKS